MGSKYAGTLEEKRALNCFIALLRCATSVSAVTHRELPLYQLSVGQFGVLDALFHLGPLRPNVLAQKLLNSGGNVTMIVDNLEKRGLVERTREKADRRCQMINLTDQGKELFQQVFPGQVSRISHVMRALSAKEQETLNELCKKLGLASRVS